MNFWWRFMRDCKTVVVPLVGIIIAAVVLLVMGRDEAASLVATYGSIVVMAGNVLYIVIFRARPRRTPPVTRDRSNVVRAIRR